MDSSDPANVSCMCATSGCILCYKCTYIQPLQCCASLNAFCKNMQSVGMVQCVSKNAYSCMKKQLLKNLHEQGAGFLHIATHVQSPQVDICVSVTIWSIFTAFWILFHHSYIWQPFDAARLCVPGCFSALIIDWNVFYNCLSTRAHIYTLLCGLWPIIQIYLAGRTYIYAYYISRQWYTVTVSIFCGHWGRPIHSVSALSQYTQSVIFDHSLTVCCDSFIHESLAKLFALIVAMHKVEIIHTL